MAMRDTLAPHRFSKTVYTGGKAAPPAAPTPQLASASVNGVLKSHKRVNLHDTVRQALFSHKPVRKVVHRRTVDHACTNTVRGAKEDDQAGDLS